MFASFLFTNFEDNEFIPWVWTFEGVRCFVCYCFHVSLAYIGIFRFQCSAITVAHKVHKVPFLNTEYLEDILHSFNMTALIFDSFVWQVVPGFSCTFLFLWKQQSLQKFLALETILYWGTLWTTSWLSHQ